MFHTNKIKNKNKKQFSLHEIIFFLKATYLVNVFKNNFMFSRIKKSGKHV